MSGEKSQDPSPVITCHSIAVPVTLNYFSALWHLRKKLGAFTIWVDAVSIDQSNEAEKATQIPLMREIFAVAQQVYVWLGCGDEVLEHVVKSFSSIGLLCDFFEQY